MGAPRPLRVYRGPDPPYRFMEMINTLSFQCGNMLAEAPGGIATLRRELPFGNVSVMRVGAMGGESYGMEFVTTELTEGEIQILLSSAEAETYGIDFNLSRVKITGTPKKIHLPADYFSETFTGPYYDLFSETCPFIFTLNHKSFIVVIPGDNTYQTVSGSRDDWHNNSYVTDKSLPLYTAEKRYYATIIYELDRWIEGGYCYSFSPYTFYNDIRHIARHINHSLRLYIPILGRGAAFDTKYPKFADCEGYPYGKKPFTRSEAGIISYREVVVPGQQVTYPSGFSLQLFWPFIPYLHEIANFNIHRLQNPLAEFVWRLALWDLGPMYAYKLQYNDAGGASHEEGIHADSLTGSFPDATVAEVRTTTIDLSQEWSATIIPDTGGESEYLLTKRERKTFTLEKYATLGTVGSRKDLHVVTRLAGAWAWDYNDSDKLGRESNFPPPYYMESEMVDTTFWACIVFHDSTICTRDLDSVFKNEIVGTQELKVGDVVIDSGQINMTYDGVETSDILHTGTVDFDKPCCGLIANTEMVDGVKTLKGLSVNPPLDTMFGHYIQTGALYALSIANPVAGAEYTWTASAGSFSPSNIGNTVNFYAPNDPNVQITITVTAREGLCDTAVIEARGCEIASIGYATQQMAVNEVQYLSVQNATTGFVYTWELVGGGSIEVTNELGTTATYTAPASNANCDQNALISLKIGAIVCDTLGIAISGSTSNTAGSLCCQYQAPGFTDWHTCYNIFGCTGLWFSAGPCFPWSGTNGCILWDPAWPSTAGVNTCASNGFDIGIGDLRSPAMLAAGCCPWQLM